MYTYTSLLSRTADICGFSAAQDNQDKTNAGQDINQGLKLLKNQARRYWTRKQAAAALVNNQQYYELPPDAVRVTEVYVNSNGLNYPVKQVSSEYLWNKINVIPAITINVPTYYFIRGRNEIGLWPLPSADAVNALNVSYEPQLEMGQADVTAGTATVSNGSTSVTFSGNTVDPTMVGRWFQVSGRYNEAWYQIATYTNSNTLELENFYGGYGSGGLDYVIGDCPDIPPDYQLGLVYYAAQQFFLKRKDKATATLYYNQFMDYMNQYRETYASKTTGVVQSQTDRYRYSIFLIPPPPITA
jgi:hypothetical protein